MIENDIKSHIGIDVSKAFLDIAFNQESKVKKIPNTPEGIKRLIKDHPELSSALIIMEASGGYERLVAEMLRQLGYLVVVANAKRVREYARSQGILAKTDALDAKVIRRYAMHTEFKVKRCVISKEQCELKALQGRREQLVKLLVMEKQHLEKSAKILRKNIIQTIKHLEKQLEKLNMKFDEIISGLPAFKEALELLQEIKSVGEVTAKSVLIHLPELGKVSNKEIASLAGLAPFNNESGKMKKRRRIKGGRGAVRRALFMATMTAVRCNPKIKSFYDRLLKRGKEKMVAMVACMRKLLIIMNTIIRDSKIWQN